MPCLFSAARFKFVAATLFVFLLSMLHNIQMMCAVIPYAQRVLAFIPLQWALKERYQSLSMFNTFPKFDINVNKLWPNSHAMIIYNLYR
jgi:hypothetical protein